MHWCLLGLLILFVLFDVYYHWFMKVKSKDVIYLASLLVFAVATFVLAFFTKGCTFCFVMVLLNEITVLIKIALFLVALKVCKGTVKEESDEK